MTLNNDIIEIEAQTITSLLEQRNISAKGIAIAVNNKVVRRTDWDTFMLSNDDKVVVITAAYGG